jgi:IS30 family transposase
MERQRRPYLPAWKKAEMWRQWRAGQSMKEISRLLDVDHGSIRNALLRHGGMVPVERTRAARTLTMAERESISRSLASGGSCRGIAKVLGRAASTVSREIARHGGRRRYRAAEADKRAWKLAKRPKLCLLATRPELRAVVASKLSLEWSPEQISGWLRVEYPNDESMRVSAETIYRTLFIQARGVLKKQLLEHLRTKRYLRHAKASAGKPSARGQIADMVSIRERPAAVDDRAVPGHWEGDLLSGSGNTHIVTLVERQSRFTTLIKVKNRETATVVKALTRHVQRLPTALRKSLTWDRGKEMSTHKLFTVATKVQVYFCDPHSPWQRGSNENTNGLLRQYLPRQTDLSIYSQAQLDKIALRLNQRPRETLGFRTPADKLRSSVASTG